MRNRNLPTAVELELSDYDHKVLVGQLEALCGRRLLQRIDRFDRDLMKGHIYEEPFPLITMEVNKQYQDIDGKSWTWLGPPGRYLCVRVTGYSPGDVPAVAIEMVTLAAKNGVESVRPLIEVVRNLP